MITNLNDFLNRKKDFIADYQNKINKLQNELAYLHSGDNKEHLLIIRKELYLSLREQIPKSLGLGYKQFREDRKIKIIQLNKILEEFDTKYLITELDLKNDLQFLRL
jgi:hypothetical protein